MNIYIDLRYENHVGQLCYLELHAFAGSMATLFGGVWKTMS
jgi:hypothetical protein